MVNSVRTTYRCTAWNVRTAKATLSHLPPRTAIQRRRFDLVELPVRRRTGEVSVAVVKGTYLAKQGSFSTDT